MADNNQNSLDQDIFYQNANIETLLLEMKANIDDLDAQLADLANQVGPPNFLVQTIDKWSTDHEKRIAQLEKALNQAIRENGNNAQGDVPFNDFSNEAGEGQDIYRGLVEMTNGATAYDHSITVRSFINKRNGIFISVSDQTFTAPDEGAPWLPSTTYYVWIEYTSATHDPCIYPDSNGYTLHCGQTPDVDIFNRDQYKMIAQFSTNADAQLADIYQHTLGDVDDQWVTPDTNSPYANNNESIEFKPEIEGDELHTNVAQLKDWDDAATSDPPSTAMFLYHPGTWPATLSYCTIEDFIDYLVTSEYGMGEIGDWLNENNYIDHTALDFEQGTEAELGVGRSMGNTDHDDVYWRAFDDGSARVGHNAFISDMTFKTSGLLEITNTTVASDGAGAIVTAGGVYAAQGVYAKKGAATQAGYFEDGDKTASILGSYGFELFDGVSRKIDFMISGGGSLASFYDVPSNQYVDILDGTYAINATDLLINSRDGFAADGNPGQTSGGAQVQIPLAGGGYILGYLRGGIITIT